MTSVSAVVSRSALGGKKTATKRDGSGDGIEHPYLERFAVPELASARQAGRQHRIPVGGALGDVEARRALAGPERLAHGFPAELADRNPRPPCRRCTAYAPAEERLPGPARASAATGRSTRAVFCGRPSDRGPATSAGPSPGGRHLGIPRIRSSPGAGPRRERASIFSGFVSLEGRRGRTEEQRMTTWI
jgi:hypothetical protein